MGRSVGRRYRIFKGPKTRRHWQIVRYSQPWDVLLRVLDWNWDWDGVGRRRSAVEFDTPWPQHRGVRSGEHDRADP